MNTRLALIGLISLIPFAAAPAAAAGTVVTRDNFIRAETDRMFSDFLKLTGGVNRFHHIRKPTPLDQQTVVRMNRDTLYSAAIIDTSEGGIITLPPSRISLPWHDSQVGPHIVLFEVCTAFTCVAACTLALPPIRDTLSEGFSHFVTSMTAPVASGGSEFAGWDLHPLESAALSRRTPGADHRIGDKHVSC